MPPLRIMCLGDSITHGAGPGGVNDNVDGYRAPLYTLLTGAGISFDFVGSLNDTAGTLPDHDHEGHNGYTTVALNAEIATWMAANPPNVILLMAGTNDVNDQTPSAMSYAAPGNLAALLAHIAAIDPTVLTLVSPVPPRTDYAPAIANTPNYNAALPAIIGLRRAAGQKVVLTTASSQLTTSDLEDGVHPSTPGYAKFAVGWYRAIIDALATPAVSIAASPLGNDRLFVGVTARGGVATLSGVTFGARTNVDAVADLTLGDGTATFTAVRTTSGQPARLAFTVTDSGGSWAASLGGGASGPLSASQGARAA
jgi:lysophospholipase L1-like esterase